MLSKNLCYVIIALVVLSSTLAVIIIQFYELETLMILLALTLIHFVAMLMFIIDIYRNSSVRYRWIWVVLMIMAPIVIMIAYTLTYVSESTSGKDEKLVL